MFPTRDKIDDETPQLHFVFNNNQYYWSTDHVGTENELYYGQAWNVIRHMKTNKHGFKGHKITKDDIIKIGRYVFKIVETSTDSIQTEKLDLK